MRGGHPEICLYKPEIPQNTGNIGRLAAATASRLHLIKPFGFDASDKNLRRAGLDYWPFLDLEIHDRLEDLLARFQRHEIAFFSKKGNRSCFGMTQDVKLLIFGQETKGLPDKLLEDYEDRCFQIPMYHSGVRSLNLANAASVIVYHQIKLLEERKHVHLP
ncbi:MAG: tRNA (cytidine(34)-2'-O)-methyltransferase [Pseudomonadota bacterium]